jgi:glycosyltransferase involved in cell wall biosynthesis
VGTAAAIVDPENVDDIASQLQKVATEPRAREQLVHQGLMRAESFDWKRVALKTLEIYLRAARFDTGLKPALASST